MVGVLAEDKPQVPFAGDQHPVQALATGTDDPAFGQNSAAARSLLLPRPGQDPAGGLISVYPTPCTGEPSILPCMETSPSQ
jgi:hypothetical protein